MTEHDLVDTARDLLIRASRHSTLETFRSEFNLYYGKRRYRVFNPSHDRVSINARERRLEIEVGRHVFAKDDRFWTEPYFREQLMVLVNWVSLTCRHYIDLSHDGVDTDCPLETFTTLKDKLDTFIVNYDRDRDTSQGDVFQRMFQHRDTTRGDVFRCMFQHMDLIQHLE